VCNTVSYLKKDFQILEKTFSKELKAIQKLSSKRKRSTNRQPSGFVKPTRISDQLAVFLGKPLGTEMARTEVTKELSSYIDANKLKDSLNGRIIHADRKLLDLLHIDSDTPLTFFNLQKYMRNHFATAASLAAEAAAAAAASGSSSSVVAN
jgi:chromatin remodeling complex protein RSC6